ncbi:non-canonical purine NTP pyrophosphatase, RdgB/HAM1 family [Methanocella sp. CWC-04]|uniref:Non-canonical purine NTP pyrophosphatase, RdgB/HAM1 family n=1 Tax=Methanooceanicella nereidis TaxID=2052831 RepID=A0AAP2W8N7_9EURY|nr:XTP/dITP diphosphatase [Methanocella sp. CWC-04]MCD1296354.1 non-canonical purine NTP pyrophosphatase, RdgB/HAM1 family [Methanocella sp. CWC-04]
MERPKLYFVTTNAGKFREAEHLFKENFDVEQVNMPYPELQDNDLGKIAAYGAKYCAEELKKPVMVEDSGLFIDALNGFPGPYSSYVQKTVGNKGILKLMEGVENRKAQYRSYLGYCEPGGEPVTFEGIWHVDVSFEEEGTMGFGYDPITNYRKYPIGEMEVEQKNEVSHRRRALLGFREWYLEKIKQ